MTKTLTVTYTVTENLEIDVKDYELTEAELDRLAKSKAKYVSPMCVDNLYWEWEEKPKAKGSQNKPPDNFWFNSSIGQVAGNEAFLITKDFPLPRQFTPPQHWKPLELMYSSRVEDLNKMISGDWSLMAPHNGWFSSAFKCFKNIKGLEILGDGNPQSMGYMVLSNKLVGILMPVLVSNAAQMNKVFRFN